MQRAPIVLTATAAGLAFTLGFNAHAKSATVATAAAPAAASSPGASASSGASTSSAAPPAPSTSTKTTRTATGAAVSTRYGDVQLKVTVAGGKIAGVQALQLPSGDPKSVQIGSYAEPLLRQSALSKQNGTVDAVSGATYTSDGYATALQSALDKAGFKAAATAGTTSG